MDLHSVWQAWDFVTWTFTLRFTLSHWQYTRRCQYVVKLYARAQILSHKTQLTRTQLFHKVSHADFFHIQIWSHFVTHTQFSHAQLAHIELCHMQLFHVQLLRLIDPPPSHVYFMPSSSMIQPLLLDLKSCWHFTGTRSVKILARQQQYCISSWVTYPTPTQLAYTSHAWPGKIGHGLDAFGP